MSYPRPCGDGALWEIWTAGALFLVSNAVIKHTRAQLCNRSCSKNTPHRPRLVVSHSTCPPLSSSPHAHSFVIGPAVIKHTHIPPLRLAAQRKVNSYRQQYADNQNISFLPAIMTTSSRMHGEFLRLLFLQAHRETTAHFIATGLPSQQNRSDNAFRFKRAAFYMGLKSKVGLVAAKASALRINLNIQGCSIVAPPLHAPSRAPLLLPLLLSHNIPLPRVH